MENHRHKSSTYSATPGRSRVYPLPIAKSPSVCPNQLVFAPPISNFVALRTPLLTRLTRAKQQKKPHITFALHHCLSFTFAFFLFQYTLAIMMEMEQQYAEQGQQEGEEMEVSCSLENAVHDANRDACRRQKNGIFYENGGILARLWPFFFCTYFRIIMERTCMLKVALLIVVCALFLFFLIKT